MARIQILQLPDGASGERRPFLLVIDQADDATRASLASTESSLREGLAEHIGARGILAFEETVEIPANEIPISADSYLLAVRSDDNGGGPSLRQRLDWELAQRRDFVARLSDALGIEDRNPGIDLVERARSICSDRDAWKAEATTSKTRLDETREKRNEFKANLRNTLTAALGMDRLRDWDDIANAARGLRKDRDAKRDCLQAAARLHQRVEHRGQTICGHCSAWDGTEYDSTDNPPILYPCDTIKALAGHTGEDATATQPEQQPS